MSSGYEVLTGELDAHARKIDGYAQRLQAAVDAARQVTMNNDAYGVICQPFAMLLQPFEEMGVNALAKGVETINETSQGMRDTVKSYHEQEASESARMGGIL